MGFFSKTDKEIELSLQLKDYKKALRKCIKFIDDNELLNEFEDLIEKDKKNEEFAKKQ